MAAITRTQAEDFLYLEAQLLDERRFEEWLELFAPDGMIDSFNTNLKKSAND